MSIRTGSLPSALLAEDPELIALLLEDYQVAKRRDHCSRADFAAGWLALARRMKMTSRKNGRHSAGGVKLQQVA